MYDADAEKTNGESSCLTYVQRPPSQQLYSKYSKWFGLIT